MTAWKKHTLLFLVFALLGYPLLYYAYKFGTPAFGGLDVFSYNKLYENWDFAHVDSPFNQRIISSFIIHLIYKSGIHYPTETAVSAFKILPAVYFSALLFNFLCVITTCVVIYRTAEKFLKTQPLLSFIAGALFLFGFGSINFLITALSDALSVLMVAGIFYYFLGKSKWQYLILLLAVFQREYIFFVFGLMAALHWIYEKKERRYYTAVIAVNVFCFMLYFIGRKTIFFTPRYVHQISFGQMISNIALSIQDIGAYVRQTFFIQNLLLIYFGLLIYKWRKKMQIMRFHLLVIFALLAEIVILSLLTRLGNNTGRYFYMVAPVIVFYTLSELLPFFRISNPLKDERG